jgi:dTDP-4-amino-4,6-dideoxygalactose transaminase
MTNVERLQIGENTSIRDALERLQETGEGILLLVNRAGQLVRAVTDGDLRRLILAGCAMTDSLSRLPPQPPVVMANTAGEAEALELMNARQVDQLPMVDSAGRPVRVLFRRNLDARILLSTPHLGDYEMGFVEEAFRTNWIAPLGPNVDAFERELAQYAGAGHAAAVSSGTAALHLALHLLDVGPGDVVFCSTLTFVASVNPVRYLGATPVFIDSDPATWNMSAAALERALADADRKQRLPKAVIVVNLYGQSADFDPLLALCDRYGVAVVEDAAESLGATYKGCRSGTLGRLGVYSFNGNKIITTSGGGMLVSAERELIEKARFLSTQARDDAPWYEHSEIGYNYRMSNVLAGIGRGQLKVLDERVATRRAVFERYVNGMREIAAIEWMPEAEFGRCTRWLSVCMLDSARINMVPAELIAALSARGIEARHVWKPMHLQPVFAGCAYYPHAQGESFSDRAFATGVCLPSGSNLAVRQQERIIAEIARLLGAGAVHARASEGGLV